MSVGKSNRWRFWPIFLIVVAAVGMSNLDLFIVNVALPVSAAASGVRRWPG
jgi:hypothetical protein